jgi:hypothetical protein
MRALQIFSLSLSQFNLMNVTAGDAHVIIVDEEQKRKHWIQSRLPVTDRWFWFNEISMNWVWKIKFHQNKAKNY